MSNKKKTGIVIVDSFHERYLLQSNLIDWKREDLVFYITPNCKYIFEIYPKIQAIEIPNCHFGKFKKQIINACIYTSKVNSETLNQKTKSLNKLKLSLFKVLRLFKFIIPLGSEIKSFIKILDDHQIEKLILSTPFQKLDDFPIGLAALKMNLKLESYVYSWDNLTAKGPLIFPLDKLYVWNEIMKQEAKYYHGYDENQVEVIGVPLYKYIYQKYLIENYDFLEMPWHNFKYKILLATIPGYYYGKGHLYLAKKIVADLNHDHCLVIRPHPLDEMDYSSLSGDQVFIDNYSSTPRGSLQTFVFERNSIDHYFSVLHSCDVVLNVASTVTIDASIVGTPTINIAFSMDPDIDSSKIKSYYKYTHYKKVLEFPEVMVANDYKELESLIEKKPKKIFNSRLAVAFGGPYKP